MKTTICEYQRGITALHNLMDMLLAALHDAMPSAELAKVGAHNWRGYVIRKYENLACGQYFCQMYPGAPTILVMEEFCNYGGRMFYPWRVDFDLLTRDFFARNADGQKALLAGFYKEAVKEALDWQNSSKRKSIVPKKIWDGRKYWDSTQLDYPKEITRVTPEYISALEQQENLFSKLKEVIIAQAKELGKELGMEEPYLVFSTKSWKYRGLWMKLREVGSCSAVPEGPFPYHFKIDLYERPEVLRFQDRKKWKEKSLDLEKEFFFGLDKENQLSVLKEFVGPILKNL